MSRRKGKAVTQMLEALTACAAGAVLGGFYFGGLWCTVRRLPRARHPAALMLGSYLLRLGVLLAAVLLVAGRGWISLAACLLGLVLSRFAACRLSARAFRASSDRFARLMREPAQERG